MKDHSTSWLNE